MGEERKTTVRISSASARYVRQDTPREERLSAARGEAGIEAADLPVVLAMLCRDPDPEVRGAALQRLRVIPRETLLEWCGSPLIHSRILELLARIHGRDGELAGVMAQNPAADEDVLAALAMVAGPAVAPPAENGPGAGSGAGEAQADESEGPEEEGAAGEDEEPGDEESEEFSSKYQLAQQMGISEKIKMAMTGDKEWRMLLIKETNKLVSISVIRNPRITEAEVLTISKSAVNNDEILRDICANKDWTKNYQIRKALIENSKTPLHHALKFLGTLSEKDLVMLSRSKNISSVISTQARRIIMNKKQEK